MAKITRGVGFLLGLIALIIVFSFHAVLSFFRFIHKKKRYAIPFYAIAGYVALIVLIVLFSGDPDFERTLVNKRVNDVTQLNPVQVSREIQPRTIEEISEAIRTTEGPVSIGGGRYSMGGQIAFENSLHIDMRTFNNLVSLDTTNKQVTVQAGMTWRDLQKKIDPHNLSVKIMQTYADFTVGGSVSVNCHGRYIGHGPIASSVLRVKLITASGETIVASRDANPEVFAAAIGGYGGIGVIAEATLQLTDNVKVERHVAQMPAEAYNDYFNKEIRDKKKVIFQNGDLYPPAFELINSVSWTETSLALTDTTRLTQKGENYWLERQTMEVVSWGDLGKWTRRNLLDPYLYDDPKVVWRNREASYDVLELEPKSRETETYVLQEYFIPVNNIRSFIPKMRTIFDAHDVNVINVSIRHAYPDKETYLSWAPEEVFAFVVYYQQGTDRESRDRVRAWTVEMTDAILSEGGRWYLPYQPHATVAQFRQGYPQSEKYFEIKNRMDPSHRFTNKLLDKYNPFLGSKIEKKRDSIKGYFRDEGQTFLTVPEWYLVFNPKEYADFLEAGNNPSSFPFYASIDEYWKLYDRSMKLVSTAYPDNEEYNTMLNVIGVSTTIEYTTKMLYENTIGRVFSWFGNGVASDEELAIIAAHRAYSDCVYDQAWYEFRFLPWIKKVWTTTNTAQSSWLRKVERKIFFTVEFSFKALYAELIGWAARASYEEPVTKIYIMADVNETLPSLPALSVVFQNEERKIISITRWGEFTKAIVQLADTDMKIIEIGGNDEIVVSILYDTKDFRLSRGELLYDSRVVTDPDAHRGVYLVHVRELLPFIREAGAKNAEIEHVFDY